MSRRCCSIAGVALLLAAAPAHALFKVVGPDGRITYTDRPPANAGKVSAFTSGGAPAPDPTLPVELRTVAARWPVTLFTSPDCGPCDEARRLLRVRGVPHTERTVMNDMDREAWQRVVGGVESPAVTIGSQSLRGLDATRWHEYLDAAGYPRSSKLPPAWQFPAALPLVTRSAEEPKRQAPARPAPAPVASDADAGEAPRFRF